MSYLKIFPLLISVQKSGLDSYVGVLRYDFERYGHMLHENEIGITLICVDKTNSSWIIESADADHFQVGLNVFMASFNSYLFKVLQFDPVLVWSDLSSSNFEFHFDRVYFDIGRSCFIDVANE